MPFIRALYDWTLSLAAHRHAVWWLTAIAFIESSVFPIPPDVLLIPMILAARDRAFRLALVCTVASVIGGMAGYGIGHFLFDTVGRPLVELYGASAALDGVRADFAENGWWIVLGGGMTPFPYKVVTIAAGALDLDPVAFAGASTVGRGARFFLVAILLWYFGAPIRDFIEKRLGWVVAAAFVLLIGGFLAIKFLV
ncbi:DedA family protein [Rhodospirillaceae bacterium KN72]|uniref:DedA family protein n=1 Tax=Pacificispira spongiicola TaxID=2729598 RepID=A0A7Y0E262_9PROT|nr:YqaA family protein [Pacificispira spongiicola]NMM45853.1 DedA family protein [Pacificispira spongiicola]